MDVFKRNSFWEKKKPFYKRTQFLVVAAIVIAVWLFMAFQGNGKNLLTTNAAAEQPNEQQSVEENQLKYNDPVVIDGVSYRIAKVDKESALRVGGVSGKSIVPDGMFYIIRFEVINIKSSVVFMRIPAMWIVSNEGDYFAPRADIESKFKSTMTEGEILQPNASLERVRFFDVSPGIENLKLLFDLGKVRYYIPLSKK